jgi:hypothetical protein
MPTILPFPPAYTPPSWDEPAGGVEWFKAAGGAWHGGGAGNSGRSRGFQHWLGLPRAKRKHLLKATDVHGKGPATVSCGSGPVKLGATSHPPITRFPGSRLPRESSTVPEPAEAGELLAFKTSNQDRLPTGGGHRFVLGSAASHPYEIYSVNKSPASLQAGEQHIAEI